MSKDMYQIKNDNALYNNMNLFQVPYSFFKKASSF